MICEILVIDQNRTDRSAEELRLLDPKVRVLTYPPSAEHFKIKGHDHAAVLNRAIAEVQGDWLALFDTDCFPIRPDWLARVEANLEGAGALLAQEAHRNGLSHPCFMLISRDYLGAISFDEGLFEAKLDTGRRVYTQLEKASANPRLLPARVAHGGWWGIIYLGCIYHHVHGSFSHAEVRLSRQWNWELEYFTKRVMRFGVRRLTTAEWIGIFLRHYRESPRQTAGFIKRRVLQTFGMNPFEI